MRSALVTHDSIIIIFLQSFLMNFFRVTLKLFLYSKILIFVTLSYLQFVRVCVSVHLIYHLFCS